MKLLIDFGNSYIKWACLNHHASMEVGAPLDYQASSVDEKVGIALANLPIQKCTQINAVSVLGEEFNNKFKQAVANKYAVSTLFYFSQKKAFGVTLAYAEPASYGADRYAALVAAAHTEIGDKLIIDIGTAVTIDVLDAANMHLGGLIFPGLSTMISALNRADGIGEVAMSNTIEYLNDTTQSAVYSGGALCIRHGIQGIVKEIQSKLNHQAIVLLTGGAAEQLLTGSLENYLIRKDLVLTGLEIMQRD